jgi:hypothetical protein
METLADHVGAWTGTNQFRLMPDDAFESSPATAQVSVAARGNLTTIAYTWSHPQDGSQEGLLVVAPSDEPHSVVTMWGDSWHQSPVPRVLEGAMESGRIVVSYEYGEEWRWQISIDATDPAALTIQMDNIVPASVAPDAAGPYAAMVADLRRSD